MAGCSRLAGDHSVDLLLDASRAGTFFLFHIIIASIFFLPRRLPTLLPLHCSPQLHCWSISAPAALAIGGF
jgi:hypothetical protein